ncbi:hypothetical protein [Streptomyces sp. MK7]|uniref:hypothetical protein n=1 Tax=Streptomyces sp. MK7 TaxID=3067635 RepID=UPI00292ECB80|nr:hypothetical protein [Streptomyces sp. MK7]
MTRRSVRGAGAAVADSAGEGPGLVAVVVPEPRDAVPLVALQPAGAEVAVVCLEAGAKADRAALDGALATAADRGCRVAGGARVLGAHAAEAAAALLEELRDLDPDRVHTLDPDPVHTGYDQASGTPTYDVPPAHAETAAQALAAARALQRETGRPVFVDCHRAGSDPRFGAAACRRYPVSGSWLSAGFDGRLTAFLPTAAGLVRRFQRVPGGGWSGPELVEGGGPAPGLLVVPDPAGLPQLFALRRTARGDGGVDVEIVHAAQYRTGEPPTPWQSLGGPNAGDWRRGRGVGFPAAAFDGAGNLFVFARNFGHSISYLCRAADGRVTPWRHLGGTRVADELTAVSTSYGGVEVYGRMRDRAGVVRWYPGPDGQWAEDPTLPFAARPGTLAPAAEPGAVLFRDLRTNEARVWRPGAPGPLPLGEADGTGPLTAVPGVELDGWPYTVLLRSGPDGRCAVGAHPEGRPDAGVWWRDLPAASYGPPAAALSRRGLLTVAAAVPGGGLLVAERRPGPAGLDFTAPQLI